jgi:glucose-1-phosphate thymidylyltransferase
MVHRGCQVYCEQAIPNGLASFCNWEEFIEDSVALVLGDNIFFGSNMDECAINKNPEGGVVFAPRFGSGTIWCG